MTTRMRISRIGSLFFIAIAAVWLGLAGAAPASSARQPAPAPAPAPPPPQGPPGHAVLVELFTSQGCSSCPPADRLLTKLGGEGGNRVVPLSFHVDFWNHGGWTDPFSSAEWTRRQVAYARVFRISAVYTPQAVVDGGAEIVGSEEAGLRAAIAAAAARPAALISLRLEPLDSKVRVHADVDLPEALRGRKLDLMFAVFETELVTPVGRGENGGSTLRNDYVVRSLRRDGGVSANKSGQAQSTATLSLEKTWNRSRLGVAAFVQDPQSLAICGASAAHFSPEKS
jgi:hypothetical protein